MTRSFVLVVVLGCAAGCQTMKDQAASGRQDPALVQAPLRDRCAAHGSGLKATCDQAKAVAQDYVRRLATGEMVCMEATFGDEPGDGCLARGAVIDTGTNRVLIEIRNAQPASRWFNRIQREVWFEEGALVDHYLAERGY